MRLRFFDFEVFPHWWCVCYGDEPEEGFDNLDEKAFKSAEGVLTSDDADARDKLLQIMRSDFAMCGYNIKGYDLVIANAIYQGFTPEQVKIVNDLIIDKSSMFKTKEHLRLKPFANRKLAGVVYQDLMDDGTGSLKEKEAILGLDIKESDVSFDKEDLTEEDKAEVILYCKHDVYAAAEFFRQIVAPYTRTKLALGKKFNIDEKTVRACTNARLVAMALGAKRSYFGDEEQVRITLPSKIEDYCKKNVPEEIYNHLVNKKDGLAIRAFGNNITYGNGGIHSTPQEDIYAESDEENVLLNVDATSYYPSILIQLDCLSRCVTEPHRFVDIFDERIAIKHKENKTKQDEEWQMADKLVLNTTFGASGNEYLDLYDPYMCTRTCRVGQIFLTALANKLYNNIPGITIMQTNTDGILVYTKRKYMYLIDEMMQEWTYVSGINMERDDVEKIWQRNVNNYMLVKNEKGKQKVKRKGAWLNDTYLKPGYVMVGTLSAFACARAAQEYLLKGTDIVNTIFTNHNLTDFVINCMKGPSYSSVIQKYADGSEKTLYKCNRIIATKDTNLGMIYKVKKVTRKSTGEKYLSYTQMANIPEHCLLVNDALKDYDFRDIKKQLDYMYYIDRAAGLLDVPWSQVMGNEIFRINRFDYE